MIIPSARAADVHWRNQLGFYGDDTEFGGPYRDGETILGGQIKSYLELALTDRVTVQAGIYADKRSGGEKFADPVEPILSFRYRTTHSSFILGALETRKRHGLIDPLEVSTLELTRPLETGIQFTTNQRHFNSDFFLNWQKLNTPDHREVFDFGWVIHAPLPAGFSLEGQLHGLHHGGQLYSVGPVYNNVNFGPGIRWDHRWSDRLAANVTLFELVSETTRLPEFRNRPSRGRGTFLRVGFEPRPSWEVFTVLWRGKDFYAEEGDRNYGSVGTDPAFFRSRREYKELGFSKIITREGGIDFTAEMRFHKIDDRLIEYSLRLLARVSLDNVIGKIAPGRDDS
ncbi:MAG TPA: hypothetical protein VHL58_14830 [Thermoanaerobaculia bacterium]|nr:hypothetical protein [Thermoanaerobaculia bacterium]